MVITSLFTFYNTILEQYEMKNKPKFKNQIQNLIMVFGVNQLNLSFKKYKSVN